MKFRSHANTLVIALLTLCSVSIFGQSPQVMVESVGVTVSDMDRSVAFYSALAFQKVSDVEVLGEQYEHLEGVFGARMRIVRMQLGNEYLDLTEHLTPRGRPIPAATIFGFNILRSSCATWTRHLKNCARSKCSSSRLGPKRCRHRSPPLLESKRSIFAIRMSITSK